MSRAAPAARATSPSPRLDALVDVPLTHRWLARPWGTQHVVEAGPPDGPPLVLLHGWPQHWYAWRHVIRALAPEARLLALDTRGFGWSRLRLDAAARRAVTTADLAADVVAALDDLEVDRAHLAGHDWGGWFAFRVALDHPHRTRSLTTAAIMPPWLSGRAVARRPTRLAYLVPMAVLGDRIAARPAAVAALVRWSSGHRGRGSGAGVWDSDEGRTALADYVGRLRSHEARQVTRLLYRRMVAVELRRACGPRPARLGVPATLVLGDREPIAHPDLFRPRTLPGELSLVAAPGAGHWVLDECPAPVVTALRGAVGT